MTPEIKNLQIGVRLPAREAERIKARAASLDVSVSELVRAHLPPSDAWAAALAHIESLPTTRGPGDALYELAAEGLKRQLVLAGIAELQVAPLTPDGALQLWFAFRNAVAGRAGVAPPFPAAGAWTIEAVPPGGQLERAGVRGSFLVSEFEEMTEDGPRLPPHRAPGGTLPLRAASDMHAGSDTEPKPDAGD